MTTEPPSPASSVAAEVELSAGPWRLQLKTTIPTGPTRLRQMLPLVQSLADAVVDGAVKAVEAQGHKVSCQKGCGACCRQLVPISEEEARRIRDLVNDLPEPRRSEVRARFAAARRQLEQAGLVTELLASEQWTDESFVRLGMSYFQQGIPCPFLEEESCSIYADRPITCREYLVTSPAANCRQPSPETVHRVPLPLRVCTVLARPAPEPPPGRFLLPVPLILAPEWADTHPDEPPPRPGPELLQELLGRLAENEQSPREPAQLVGDPIPVPALDHGEAQPP